MDCLSVLQGLHARLGTLQRYKHYLNPDALLTSQLDLVLLSRTAPTHFLKVKAHECDPLNELVDDVAKLPRPPHDPPHLMTIPDTLISPLPAHQPPSKPVSPLS